MRDLSTDEAQTYLTKPGLVELIDNPRVVRTLRLLPLTGPDGADSMSSSGGKFGQRYSHKRETRTNVQGVWTFRRLTFHAAYIQSVLDCLKA